MQSGPKKLNQLLARDREARKRADLMLYIVNLPFVDGWSFTATEDAAGLTAEELKDFTERLRETTQEYWPELWRPIENQESAVEDRAWAIIFKLRWYLREFWKADNKRTRDWYIFRARLYYHGLDVLPELLTKPEADRVTFRESLLDRPPKRNLIEKALFELQERAEKPKLAPRVCPNDCERRFFLSTEKGQKYCPECRRSEAARARTLASKRKSWEKNKKRWRKHA